MPGNIMFFVGMDIGDAESVVAICSLERYSKPTVIPSACMPTVVAQSRGGKPRIGYDALRVRDPIRLDASFKCDPETNYAQWRYETSGAILLFVEELHQRVLAEHPELRDCHQVLIGCPAGWSAAAVERYATLVADSPLLGGAVIERESRGALLQAWEFEDLPVEALTNGVMVIDIGSSTIDCSLVRDGSASEHPVGAAFGLRDLDERIYQAYIDSHPAAEDRRQQYDDNPVAQGFVRYLCRLHKERAFGAAPDLSWVPDGWDWLRREWDVLNGVDVPALLEEPDGWLDRYRVLVRQLAAGPGLVGTTVLLTGGGAFIPQIAEVTRQTVPYCRVHLAQDPMTGVAKGLAARGWLDRTVMRFEAAAKDLLCAEPAMTKVRALYPDFLNKSFDYLKDAASTQAESVGLVLASQSQFTGGKNPLEKFLFKKWLENLEATAVLDGFADAIASELESDFDRLAREYSIRTGQWRPVIKLKASELVASQSPPSALDAVLERVAAISLSVLGAAETLPMQLIDAFPPNVVHNYLEKLHKARLTRIKPRMTPEVSELFDRMVTQGISRALTDSLESVRAMLLDATRPSSGKSSQ